MRVYVYTPPFSNLLCLERSIRQLVQGLTTRGHECKVLIMRTVDGQYGDADTYGPNVILCGRDRDWDKPADPFIHAALDLQHTLRLIPVPDVIITLSSMCTGAARVAINMMDEQPSIVSFVSGIWGQHEQYEQLIYADAHLAISSGIAEKIAEMTPDARIQTVFQPAHDEDIEIVPRAATPTFIYIGRMHNLQKRIDVMLRALAALPNKQWRLRLIEDALPEPGSSDKIRMKDLAYKLGIADRIEWVGYRESPWEEVDEATLLILPSDWEAFCYILIDALNRGIPVISSDCPTGPRDIVKHGHNGWLFKPGDVLGLAGTISCILSGSLVLPDAETCRQSVAHFDQERVMDHIEQVLFGFMREKDKQIS